MMALAQIFCPNCGSEKVVKRGKSADGKQRYLCRNEDCDTKSLIVSDNWIFPERCAILLIFWEQKIFFRRNIMMALVQIFCPNCGSEKIVRRGKNYWPARAERARVGTCRTLGNSVRHKAYGDVGTGCGKKHFPDSESGNHALRCLIPLLSKDSGSEARQG